MKVCFKNNHTPYRIIPNAYTINKPFVKFYNITKIATEFKQTLINLCYNNSNEKQKGFENENYKRNRI